MNYIGYVFWFTVKQATLSTLFTIPLAVLIARALVWNQRWWPAQLCMRLLGLPLITPALVGILGFITLMGGLFNIYSLAGIVAVHVVFYSPWVALLLVSAWRLIPEEHYRLSCQLNFSSRHTFYFIEWPQLRKSILELGWICFCLSLNSFTTIMVLGGGPQKTTLSAGLYHSLFFFYDFEQVTWFVGLQLILTLSLAVFTLLLKALPHGVSLKRPSLPDLKDSTQKPFVWVGLGLICLPLIVILGPSLTSLSLTLQNPLVWQALEKSLVLAVCFGSLSAVISLCLVVSGWQNLKYLAGLHFLFPSTLLGVLLFLLSLQMPSLPQEFFLGVMQVLLILPFTFLLLERSYRTLEATYGTTTLSLGLPPFQKFFLIQWPLLKKPFATALGLGCALSAGDFPSLAFFSSPDCPGLSSLFYQQMGRHFEKCMGTALILLLLCYFLYQLPHWILRTHDRTSAA
jgi:thiamine transport system permease protein